MLRLLVLPSLAAVLAALPLLLSAPTQACEGHDKAALATTTSGVTLASNGGAHKEAHDANTKAAPTPAPGAPATATDATIGSKTEKLSDLPVVTVEELSTMIEKSKKDPKTTVAVFDANGEDTRKSKGSIPGAVLLPSSSKFELTMLPAKKDQTLVFYCANEKCGASHSAAKRAVEAGYKQVKVLSAGIDGWVAAGKPVTKQPSA